MCVQFFIFVISAFFGFFLQSQVGAEPAKVFWDNKNAPCASDFIAYCPNERGNMVGVCLRRLPEERLTENCRKYLAEEPKIVAAEEKKFVDGCAPFIKQCKDLAGETMAGKIARRKCIFAMLSKVDEKCRDAFDRHMEFLRPNWRPKGWKPKKPADKLTP